MDSSDEAQVGAERRIAVERVQIGARMEKRMVKVLKGLAEYHDMSLGDLLEGIVLHAFENQPAFSEATRRRIGQLKEIYGMDYGLDASHRFVEAGGGLAHDGLARGPKGPAHDGLARGPKGPAHGNGA